jgi:hypothetical protein
VDAVKDVRFGLKSAGLTLYRRLPVTPDKQTLLVSVGMSQSCRHFRTYAMQQSLFDHLVRGSEKGGPGPQDQAICRSRN